ncbi:MAG TPA: hypothetical protein PKM63_22255 [Panacibacter sp.]|nr:hypothetical protein [Panacibacter sp.]HNP47037.1 hypothetical protein [Panacibacter sp.]
MDTENKYVKGFNTGYFIAKHESNLSNKLVKNSSNTDDFFRGLIDGTLEVKLEFQRRQLFILEEIRKKGNDIGLLYDKD